MSEKDKKKISFIAINDKIASAIASNANEGALNTIIDKRVKAEVTRRADLLEKAVAKYNTAKADLANCKPDMNTFVLVDSDSGNESGVPIKNEAYSEKKFREKESLQKLISGLDIALMLAFDEGDYSKLEKLLGNGNNQKQKPTETE